MASNTKQPEIYYTRASPHCPNSHLPILVYRNVLPSDLTVESAQRLFVSNDWTYDQCWPACDHAHFHTNTHECYAALRGRATCLYGVGPLDEQSDGTVFHMEAGDIAVHTAGVSYMNIDSEDDYLYMGVYPKDSPLYDSHASTCDVEDTRKMARRAESVPIPICDSIYGAKGPLPMIRNNIKSGN